jgi:tripeptidyl-peptidase-1
MAPRAESVTAITRWLAAHNLTAQPIRGYGDWLGLTTTVAHASALFAADLSVFKHLGTGATQVRTLQYSIPAGLKGHLEVAHPLTRCVRLRATLRCLSVLIHSPSFFEPQAQRSTTYAPAVETKVKSAAPNVDSSCASLMTPVCLQELYGLPAGKPKATGAR